MAVTPRLHEEAYALFKEKLGPDDRETLRSMTGLGDAYGRAHRADDSVRILEESTARMRANLGDEDPDTLDAMEALARAYQRVRRQKEAVTLLETIVRIQRHRHGPSHALTAMSVSNLAVAYGIVGRIAEEITLLEEVAPIVQAKFGAMHPETWQLSHNLAHAYALAERPAHEVHVRQQMLDNIQRVRKVTDIDRISAMFDLAEAFEHAGRRGDAIRMLTETLAIERSALGDLDSNTLACMIRLATLLHLDGQSQGAQPLVKEFMRSLVGVNENRFVEHLGRAGRELVSSNPQVAEPLLRHCLSIRLRLAPQEWKCFATRSLLGEALAGQQQYAEAEPELLAAYDGLLAKVDQIPERSRRELADAAGRLVRLYALLDNLPESKKWKAQEVKHREAPW